MPDPNSPTTGMTAKYDAWNRLVEVDEGGGALATYRYDGTGQRIVSQSGGVFVHYFYADQQVVETRNATSASAQPETLQPKYQYVWSAGYVDSPIRRDENTDADNSCDDGRIYYLTDANHNVTAITDASGGVVERYVYDPYGKRTIYDATWANTRTASSYANTLGFTGQQLDPATGLSYYRARWYHPGTGGMIERDPEGFSAGDENLYRYVADNPLSHTDPTGRWDSAASGGSSGAWDATQSTALLTVSVTIDVCVDNRAGDVSGPVRPSDRLDANGGSGFNFNLDPTNPYVQQTFSGPGGGTNTIGVGPNGIYGGGTSPIPDIGNLDWSVNHNGQNGSINSTFDVGNLHVTVGDQWNLNGDNFGANGTWQNGDGQSTFSVFGNQNGITNGAFRIPTDFGAIGGYENNGVANFAIQTNNFTASFAWNMNTNVASLDAHYSDSSTNAWLTGSNQSGSLSATMDAFEVDLNTDWHNNLSVTGQYSTPGATFWAGGNSHHSFGTGLDLIGGPTNGVQVTIGGGITNNLNFHNIPIVPSDFLGPATAVGWVTHVGFQTQQNWIDCTLGGDQKGHPTAGGHFGWNY